MIWTLMNAIDALDTVQEQLSQHSAANLAAIK